MNILKDLFKKKYRIIVTKAGKYKRYYPEKGILFFTRYYSQDQVYSGPLYFTSEDLARMYINDRVVEDEKEVVIEVIKVK